MDIRYFSHAASVPPEYDFSGLDDGELFAQYAMTTTKVSMAEDLLETATSDFQVAAALCEGHKTLAAGRHLSAAKEILSEAEGELIELCSKQAALRCEINGRYPDLDEGLT